MKTVLPRHISPGYHDELVAACQQAGFSPDPQNYANSVHSQFAMVECGVGVTLVPESSVWRQHRTLVWRELRKRVDLVELSVVCRAGEEPLVDHFIACTRAPADEGPRQMDPTEDDCRWASSGVRKRCAVLLLESGRLYFTPSN